MLAIQRLIQTSKLERALPGNVLPTNNNRGLLDLEGVYCTTVLQSDGDKPAGFGLFQRCSPNQFYCSLISISDQFVVNFVNVECAHEKAESEPVEKDTQGHSVLKISNCRSSMPDLSGLPQYYSAFAEPEARPLLQCILEEFIKTHVGNANVELRRNFTVDLYDANSDIAEQHPDVLWRDCAGFLLTDRFRHCELELPKDAILAALGASQLPAGTAIEPLSAANRSAFHEYDNSMAVMDRQDYLEFLLAIQGVYGVIALDEQRQPLGYALALGDRLLQCYAEEQRVAMALLGSLCDQPSCASIELSMFLRLGQGTTLDALLLPLATKQRRVRRLHSRIMPTNVKWTKVFALNMGAHLF